MAEITDRIADEKIERYLSITGKALGKLKIAAPERSYGRRLAESFLEMANCYYSDAKHFRDTGDYVTAFASVNYAHAWLDCGARIGLFDVDGDDVLFTLYERSRFHRNMGGRTPRRRRDREFCAERAAEPW
ncbi:MAG: DUF357 domain-containing protein [Candidatus Methanomethylophilaceae archaeon]|nr:DUF357 domain-containing protein [Candidatus Methanomethylophilaceae archaeon]